MSMEKVINEISSKIAETVIDMIPEQWKIIYFYAQISETGGGTYFFYNTPEDEQNYIYSLDIPFKHSTYKQRNKMNARVLLELSEKLKKTFIDYQQEPWYSFTLSFDMDGKSKMYFDYTNWFDTSYSFNDQLRIWEYKYLGNQPNNESDRKLIDKYLKEYPNNPI